MIQIHWSQRSLQLARIRVLVDLNEILIQFPANATSCYVWISLFDTCVCFCDILITLNTEFTNTKQSIFKANSNEHTRLRGLARQSRNVIFLCKNTQCKLFVFFTLILDE